MPIEYIIEVGGCFVSYRLLDDAAARLPGIWAILCRAVLPILLILGWRCLAGQPWRVRDMGMARPARGAWLEVLWLLTFQITLLLGVSLAIARFRFYSLLGFLVEARSQLNGYPANYGPFVLAAALFAFIYFAWGGELLCRGFAQGYGTIRMRAADGAIVSWLAFGGFATALALKLNHARAPAACLWGLFALFPGPVCEAFYFRNRSVLPLMIARTISTGLSLAGAGLFLYWYPDRSFSAALPLVWATLFFLILISGIGARRLLPFWRTTVAMLRIGIARGLLPGIGLAAIVVGGGLLQHSGTRAIFCLAAAVLVFFLRSGTGASGRTKTIASGSAGQGEKLD